MGFLDNLNNPRAQLGLRMLAGNSWNQNVGAAFGQAALGQQADAQKAQDDEMRRQLLQAQIANAQAPKEDNSRLEIVLDENGNPQYSTRGGAVGKTPYLEKPGSASDTGLIQEWKASGEPDYMKFLQRRSRAMAQPQAAPQEPLVVIQTPEGPRYVPRSAAAGAAPGVTAPTAPGDDGLNARQRAGVNMKQESAINYAASITHQSPEAIRQVLATEGPEGVKKLILSGGNRLLQGTTARVLSKLPFGQVAVDSANADLIAPVKSGGAGIALSQNPQGTITSSDIAAGESQMPNPLYPLDTQAEMIRQMLIEAEKRGGTAPGPAGAAPASNVIRWEDLK